MLVDVRTGVKELICSMIAQVNGNSDEVVRLSDGVYQIGHFSFDMILEANGVKFKDKWELGLNDGDYASDTDTPSCGVCDSWEQVLEKYPEIKESSNRFCMSVTPIVKAKQSVTGGWRWHKWGEYIGTQNPEHEYLYDEKDIEIIYCFHIYWME